MQIKQATKSGDTIIEVMFSFAVFGLIAILGLSIMQKGMAISQTALEINLTRNQMNTQAEALRLINSSYLLDLANNDVATDNPWEDIVGKASSIRSYKEITDGNECKEVAAINSNAFAINPRANGASLIEASAIKKATVYPRLVFADLDADLTDGNKIINSTNLKWVEGIWIEGVKGPNPTDNFYDFHIRACWQAGTSSVPTTLDTLVRLYVP